MERKPTIFYRHFAGFERYFVERRRHNPISSQELAPYASQTRSMDMMLAAAKIDQTD